MTLTHQALLGSLLVGVALPKASAEDFPSLKNLGTVEASGKALGRSMHLLESSTAEQPNTVRILFYGQSITEQKWTQAVEADLRRRYPHANLTIENRAIGGHSSQLLVKTAEADLYPFYPDLLIFHVYGDHRRYEDIIRRVRERTTADILLQSDHFSADQPLDEETDAAKLSPAQWAPWFNHVFLPGLAAQYQVELADQRGHWKQYLQEHNLKPADLLSDNVHLNGHGEFLMAEIVNAHLRLHPEASQNEGRVVTTSVGQEVKWDGEQLTLDFDGNKIDACFEAGGKGEIEVRINGKKPSEIEGCYVFSRSSAYPQSKWPALLQVRRGGTPLQLETWTITLAGLNDEHTQFSFTLTGSETGPDGEGKGDERFVSKSGRIVIEPDDWNLAFCKKVFNKPFPEDGRITFQVLPMFTDSFTSNGTAATVTLAQGIPNRMHTLQLRGGPNSGLTSLKAYKPPLQPTADTP